MSTTENQQEVQVRHLPAVAELKRQSRKRLLNREELAYVLGVHRSTIYRWEKRHREDPHIPPLPREVDGSVVRFEYAKVVEWVSEYTEQ